jgi:hypothetical protein
MLKVELLKDFCEDDLFLALRSSEFVHGQSHKDLVPDGATDLGGANALRKGDKLYVDGISERFGAILKEPLIKCAQAGGLEVVLDYGRRPFEED